MANSNEKEFETLLGDFSIPDKVHLGWTPAETVFVSVAADETVTEFIPVAVAGEAESTVIEYALGDIQAIELIADFNNTDGTETDLNALLDSFVPSPGSEPDESNILTSLDDVINDAPSSLVELTGLEFGGLTVIIDDDGADTVAI